MGVSAYRRGLGRELLLGVARRAGEKEPMGLIGRMGRHRAQAYMSYVSYRACRAEGLAKADPIRRHTPALLLSPWLAPTAADAARTAPASPDRCAPTRVPVSRNLPRLVRENARRMRS
jgi:hypothetical protein